MWCSILPVTVSWFSSLILTDNEAGSWHKVLLHAPFFPPFLLSFFLQTWRLHTLEGYCWNECLINPDLRPVILSSLLCCNDSLIAFWWYRSSYVKCFCIKCINALRFQDAKVWNKWGFKVWVTDAGINCHLWSLLVIFLQGAVAFTQLQNEISEVPEHAWALLVSMHYIQPAVLFSNCATVSALWKKCSINFAVENCCLCHLLVFCTYILWGIKVNTLCSLRG